MPIARLPLAAAAFTLMLGFAGAGGSGPARDHRRERGARLLCAGAGGDDGGLRL